MDADCDGIDGEIDAAVFVVAGWEGASDGSRDAPYPTLAAGLDAAVQAGKSQVLVAAGSYHESVVLRAGVGLHGGYGADHGWTRDLDVFESRIEGGETAVSADGLQGEGAALSGFVVAAAPGRPADAAGGSGGGGGALVLSGSADHVLTGALAARGGGDGEAGGARGGRGGDGTDLDPAAHGAIKVLYDTLEGGVDNGRARGTLVQDRALADPDGDGLTNADEAALGTDPDAFDSDGDGLPDGAEVGDPGQPADEDGNGVIDALEPAATGATLAVRDGSTVPGVDLKYQYSPTALDVARAFVQRPAELADNERQGLDAGEAGLVLALSADFGTGADGPLSVHGTAYTDSVRTPLRGLNVEGQAFVRVVEATGFAAGDEVLLVTIVDGARAASRAGQWETKRVTSVSLDTHTLYFATGLGHRYEAVDGKAHQALRVPQHTDVTVPTGAVLTAHAWDGATGGVVAFRATGTVRVLAGGRIHADGIGYRGGPKVANGHEGDGFAGEGLFGTGSQGIAANGNGGGGGGHEWCHSGNSGGGGSNATPGAAGVWNPPGYSCGCGGRPHCRDGGAPGEVVGEETLARLFMGGGGGSGGHDGDNPDNGGTGGDGGGVLFVAARRVQAAGTVSARGGGAPNDPTGETGGGGGGAGGSVYLVGRAVEVVEVDVAGGSGAPGASGRPHGGRGGDGRVRLDAVVPPDVDGAYTASLERARNGETTSPVVAPVDVVRWGTLTYRAEAPEGSTLTVDLLDDAGQVLLADLGSPTDLDARGVNARRIRLSATFHTDDPSVTPTLTEWEVTYLDSGEAEPASESQAGLDFLANDAADTQVQAVGLTLAQTVDAGDGRDGTLKVDPGQEVRTDAVRAPIAGSNPAGQGAVRLADTTGFAAGDQVLLVTMQDGGVESDLAGQYEVVTLAGISGNTLLLEGRLANAYVATADRKHQAIRVPQYTEVLVKGNGRLSCAPWDGQTGGVLAV